jgi:hypothetical protein
MLVPQPIATPRRFVFKSFAAYFVAVALSGFTSDANAKPPFLEMGKLSTTYRAFSPSVKVEMEIYVAGVRDTLGSVVGFLYGDLEIHAQTDIVNCIITKTSGYLIEDALQRYQDLDDKDKAIFVDESLDNAIWHGLATMCRFNVPYGKH